MKECLVMIMESGNFYPVEAVAGVGLEQQAKDHGELNPHLVRVEDAQGHILWERPEETVH